MTTFLINSLVAKAVAARAFAPDPERNYESCYLILKTSGFAQMHSPDHPCRESRRWRSRSAESEARDDTYAVLRTWLGAVTDLNEQLQNPRKMKGEAPLILHVDALSALQHNAQMGSALMMRTDACCHGLLQQLRTELVLADSTSLRIWIRLSQPIIPCSDLGQLLSVGSVLSSSLPSPTLVRFVGIVHMLSTTRLQCYSRSICCASCSSVQIINCMNGSSTLMLNADGEILDHERGGQADVCCEIFGQGGDIIEDMSQRVMIPAQEVWISCVSSAICKPPFGVFQQSVRVSLVEDLTGTVQLGDVVEVLGIAAVQLQGSELNVIQSFKAGDSAPKGVVQVHANNITRVVPHICWLSDSPITARTQTNRGCLQHKMNQGDSVLSQPCKISSLQTLCNLLEAAQGSHIPVYLCLALLASAAAVSTSHHNTQSADDCVAGKIPGGQVQSLHLGARLGTADAGSKGARNTINLLLGTFGMDPTGARLLIGAAALLSPHSITLGPNMEDAILPRLEKASGKTTSEGEAALLVVSSVLTRANRGILVADASVMGVKEKAQLADLLPRTVISLPRGASKQVPPLTPLTATVWAVASYNLGHGDSSNKRQAMGGGPTPMAGAKTGHGWGGLSEAGFDLLLLLPEDDHAAAAYVFGSTADSTQDVTRATAKATLRAHIAHSIIMKPPALTEPCLSLLSTYIVAVRQSMLALSQADLVGLLVKLATAFARLMQRQQVQICPDCVLAVLLCEDHLACRFGDSYMGLGLPRLSTAGNNMVDKHLGRVYAILESALKGYASNGDIMEQ